MSQIMKHIAVVADKLAQYQEMLKTMRINTDEPFRLSVKAVAAIRKAGLQQRDWCRLVWSDPLWYSYQVQSKYLQSGIRPVIGAKARARYS